MPLEFSNVVEDAIKLAGGKVEISKLSQEELQVMEDAFDRQLDRQLRERPYIDIYEEYKTEILLAAMIAKKQMSGSIIAGDEPESNQIAGPLILRPEFLGLGDDWKDISSIYGGSQSTWTTGSAQNWIHAGTTPLGGTSGNDIRILENQVTVFFAVESLHPSPKLNRVQFRINNQPLTPLYTADAFRDQDFPVRRLNIAKILYKDTQFRAQVFFPNNGSSSVTDWIRLHGISFIKETAARVLDPASLPGSTYKVVEAV